MLTHAADVFFDRDAGTSEQVTDDDRYGGSPTISGDGSSIAYESYAHAQIHDIFIWYG